MRGRLTVSCLVAVAALFGMVVEVAAGTPISSCGMIMESGSYELTQSIASYGGDCIVVQAEFVTIDLKGFSISGGGGGWGTGISGWGRGLSVRDGTVYNFSIGILTAEGAVIERMRLVSNGVGVQGGSPYGPAASVVVKDSVFHDNTSQGVSMGGGTVTGNLFNRNSTAIRAHYGGTIANNMLSQNGIGIESYGGMGVSIRNNTVLDSWNVGISVMCPANVIGNTVTGSFTPIRVEPVQVWDCNFDKNLIKSR